MAVQQMASPPFKSQTRRNRIPLQDLQFTAAGQNLRVDLPQVGYAAILWVTVFGTITTTAAGAGTWNANYFPWNLFSNIALRSNEGLEIYRGGGVSNMLVQQLGIGDIAGFNPDIGGQVPTGGGLSVQGHALSTRGSTQGARVAVIQAPTGALAASTTYNMLVQYAIPITTDYDLRAGLLLLQNQAIRVSLEMQLGQFTDWAGASAAGLSAINLTVRPELEFFAVPSDPGSQPNTDFIHRWVEDAVAWTASGDQTYKVPVSGVVSRVFVRFENVSGGVGIPQVFFSSANNPNTPNFGNLSVQYAGSQKPEIVDFRTHLYYNRAFYNQDFMDGVFLHDFSLGGGGVSGGWDGRDVYDTSQLTEFSIISNTTVTPAAGSKIYYLREELQRRAA